MKAMILAGGMGTRFAEETDSRPKPMIEIGGKPIIWHIMKTYSCHGINDFIICLGYKGHVIKEFFANHMLRSADMTVDLRENKVSFIGRERAEPWNITLVETGESSGTGHRMSVAAKYLDDDQDFCMTYGDGVSNVDITASIAYHTAHGKLATVSAVHPLARFGHLKMNGDFVEDFVEKPIGEGGWINGGFFVIKRDALDIIGREPETMWEHAPLSEIAKQGELKAFMHEGFWQPMDTLRDKRHLEGLWESGNAPWRIWK